jgi:hypothetical protein
MKINDKFYEFITDFNVINESQFIAVTDYGVVLFDITMNFNNNFFTKSDDAIAYIESILK